MGYLSDNLPDPWNQIGECPELYKLLLRVRHRSAPHALSAAETDDTIGKIIRTVVPDSEDWQFSGGRGPSVGGRSFAGALKGFVEFRFHNDSHRSRAIEELRFNGYYTETVDE